MHQGFPADKSFNVHSWALHKTLVWFSGLDLITASLVVVNLIVKGCIAS